MVGIRQKRGLKLEWSAGKRQELMFLSVDTIGQWEKTGSHLAISLAVCMETSRGGRPLPSLTLILLLSTWKPGFLHFIPPASAHLCRTTWLLDFLF
jgi:hypothetical protein